MSTSIFKGNSAEIASLNTCIQTVGTVKRGSDNPLLSIRLNDAENIRFWRLMDTVKSRSPYVGKSDVIRELLGLSPLTALTKDEIEYFRTGRKTDVVAHISPADDIRRELSEPLPHKTLPVRREKKKTGT